MAPFKLPFTVLIAAAVACTGGDGTDGSTAEKTDFDCVLGSTDVDTGFAPFSSQDRAELYFGFQGFLFLEVQVQSEEPVTNCQVTTSINVDGEDPVGGMQPGVPFVSQDDGSLLSDDIIVFMPSSSAAEWADRAATLSVRVEDATRVCVSSAEILLVDEDPCIHTDDEPICPGDTGAPEP